MIAYTFNREEDLYKAVIRICDNDFSDMSEAEQKQFLSDVLQPFTYEERTLIHNFVAAIGDIKNYYSQGMN